MWDIINKKHIPTEKMLESCKKHGLLHVPVVDDNFVLDHGIDDLLKIAEAKSELCESQEREGIVFVLKDSEHKVSFKAISNKYLL